MGKVRVPRKGVTPSELTAVLSRRLGARFEITPDGGRPDGGGGVVVRRSVLSAAVVRIKPVPGATVFRVRGAGVPLVSFGTTRAVTDALRKSPEFRSV